MLSRDIISYNEMLCMEEESQYKEVLTFKLIADSVLY